jgi:hypothetical protein
MNKILCQRYEAKNQPLQAVMPDGDWYLFAPV